MDIHFKKIMKIITLIGISITGLATYAFAQGENVELNALIKDALAHNQQIQSARHKWEAAKSRIPQASALPNPTAGYVYMGEMMETRLGPQENIYEFEQEIPFPGKLVQKRKVARAELEQAEAELKAVERNITAKVARVYYDLYALRKSLALTEQINGLSERLESVVHADYASMRGSQAEVLRIQTQLSQVLEKLFMLRQQEQSLTAYLSALLNRDEPLDNLNLMEPSMPVLDVSLEQLLARLDTSDPQILQALAMANREEHALALTKYENAPDFSVGFQYVEIGDGTTSQLDDGQDAWMIPIKVTLPLWQNRIGSAIKEAKNNLKSSQAQLKDTINTSEYELKNAYFQFVSQQQIVRLYQDAYLPQAELMLQSRQAGYESTQTNIIDLIESERVYLETQINYNYLLADALKNYAEIERLVGPENLAGALGPVKDESNINEVDHDKK